MESYLNKAEKKLLKFQTKAQECVSREEAVKLIKKYDKKLTKLSEGISY